MKLVPIAIVSGSALIKAPAAFLASSRMPTSVSSSMPVVPAWARSNSNLCAGATTDSGTSPAEAVFR